MFNRAKKIALIIGNGRYVGSRALSNSVNDAAQFGRSLSDLDFNVTLKLDLTYVEMNNVIDGFIQTLEKTSVDVCLFYFSGHGVQVHNENYIVPIDYDSSATDGIIHLVRVQRVIDRISANSSVRIILLDACRTNSPNQMSLGSKSIVLSAESRAIYINNESTATVGLAEIKAETNTFIAFAAAPGGVAYDGDTTLSPFTSALIKYVDSVDLPLSNLTSRVRQEVLKSTNGMQSPWDQSSLIRPFFFNPGSLLLFMGNFMALVALMISVVPYSLVLASPDHSQYALIVAGMLPLMSLGILIGGMQRAYSRVRGKFVYDPVNSASLRNHFVISLQKGVLGGYIGALIGGIWISVPYHWIWTVYADLSGSDAPESLGSTVLKVIIATAASAGVLGFLTIFCTKLRVSMTGIRVSKSDSSLMVLCGSAFGGALSGALLAPVLMLYFSRSSSGPPVTPLMLLPGSIIGASIVVFTIVNFDLERLTVRRAATGAISAIVALLCGMAATMIIFFPLYHFGVVELVIRWLEMTGNSNTRIFIIGGVIYGVPVGLALGLVMGSAIIFTERWSGKPVIFAS